MLRPILSLALACATVVAGCVTVPRFEAAGDIRAFLVAIRNGDQAGFDAHVDRGALKTQLKSRLVGEEAQAHGAGSWQALGAVAMGPLVDVGVDALVQPQTFRAAAQALGYAPDRPLPSRLEIDAFLRSIGDGEVCVFTRRDGPCTLVFRNEDGTWRLVGYEGDVSRLMKGKL